MRMIRFVVVWLWLMVCSTCVWAGRTLVVPNGGFESGSTEGWTVRNPTGAPLDWTVTDETNYVKSGQWAGCLSSFGGTTGTLEICNSIDVHDLESQTLIRFRYSIKTENLRTRYRDVWLKSSLMPVLYTLDGTGRVLRRDHGLGYFVGDYDYMALETLFNVPPGAARIEIRFELSSAITSGRIWLDAMTCEVVDDLGPTSTNIPEAIVRPDAGGTPRLFIDQRATAPCIFFAANHHPVVFEEIGHAAKAGVDLLELEVLLPWGGMSTGVIEQALRANPEARLILRVPIYPPFYWEQLYPGQASLHEDGLPDSHLKLPSLASDAFIADVKQQLELFIRFIHNSPYKDRVLGYHPTFNEGGEWFHASMHNKFSDFSEVNRQRFGKWLAGKYDGNISKLNAAWGCDLSDFSQAAIPAADEWRQGEDGLFRDPACQQSVPDYYQYHNQLVADRIEELCAQIKRLTQGRSLALAFYGYQRELVGNGSRAGTGHGGHLALRHLLKSPNLDIVCSPVSYFDRQPGGPSNIMSITDSIALAGKIYLQEDDSRTYLWKNAAPSLFYPTQWDTMQCLRRNFGNVLVHNMAIWWMDLCANGNFNSPAIWSNNARLREVCQDTIDRQIAYRPQVALLYDEESFFWLKSDSFDLTMPNVYLQRSMFQSMGAPVGEYYVNDADRLPDSVRMVVFVNTFRLDAEERLAIERLKAEGRTLVWLYAPGYVNELGLSIEAMKELTGIELQRNAQAIAPTIFINKNAALAGLDGMRFGPEAAMAPTFAGMEDDSENQVLGRYEQTDQPAFLMRRFPDWTSVFCGSPILSTPVLRGLARQADVALLADPDDLMAEDAITFNGRYLFAYARRTSGLRVFVLPGECLADGGFERHASMTQTNGEVGPVRSGQGAWQSGPLQGLDSERQVLTEIPFSAAGEGDWLLSGWVYLDGLSSSAAKSDDYLALTVESSEGAPALVTLPIAQGQQVNGDDQCWFRIQGLCHLDQLSPTRAPLMLRLVLKGNYQANNIALDDLSFRLPTTAPVDVQDVMSGATLARGVTSWGALMQENEQRIFRLTQNNGAKEDGSD